MRFNEKLKSIWKRNNSLVCVGLDPDLSRFPKHITERPDSIFEFCKEIIDNTYDLVCAFKPQIAYFASESAEPQLEKLIAYLKSNYPDIPIVLDAKRGDIGTTAQRYAIEAFERYGADAVTVNPYMGFDSAEPFLNYKDKGTVLLCRTSNSGAGDIQDLEVDGVPLYKHVAKLACENWNRNKNCSLVVGATWPSQMAEIREMVGDMPFLVPGVGAQGGDVASMVKAGQTLDGTGLIISSSRAILYASNGLDYAAAARSVTLGLRDEINLHRKAV